MCRREHGLTWSEFQDLTLPQLEALEERRVIELRHNRFNAALVASAVYNSHKGPNTEPLSPFDFLPDIGDAEDRERERKRRIVKKQMGEAIHRLPLNATRERVLEMRARVIAGANAEGFNGEELYQEIFPDA